MVSTITSDAVRTCGAGGRICTYTPSSRTSTGKLSGASVNGGGTTITAPRTVTVNGAFTVGTLAFNNPTQAFTLAAGSGANIILDNGAAGAFINDAAGSHSVQSPVSLTANGVTISVLTAGDTLSMSGVVSGTAALTKIGNGTLALTGANTYVVNTQINAGTIQINNAASLGDESTLTTIGTATLQAIDNVATTRNFDITDVASALSVDAGKTFSIFGSIGAGAGTLNKTGTGTLALSGANSYTGGTVIVAGTLNAASDAAFGTVPGAAGPNVTLDDTATLQAGASFTLNANRGVVLNSGTVAVDANGNALTIAGAVSGSGTLDKIGAGTLTLNGIGTYSGGTIIDGGTLSIGNSISGGITMSNLTTVLVPTGGIGNAITLSGTNANATILATAASNGMTGSIIGSADQTFTIGGTMQVSFGGSNFKQFQTHFGTVEIPAGATARFSATSLANGGDNTTFDVNGFMTTRNNGAVALGALTGAGTVTMGTAGSNGQGATYTIGAKSIDTEFSGAITDGDVVNGKLVNVVKTGSATQTLTGVNTYTGATTINGGTLQIGNGGTTGSLGTTVVTDNGTLAFNHSDAISIANTITGTGTLAQSGTGALTIAGTESVASVLVHKGSVVVDTGGSLTSTGFISIGNQAGETGVMTVQGNGVVTATAGVGDLNVSDLGGSTGTLNVTGGTVTATSLWVGKNFDGAVTGGTGTVNQSGGAITVAGVAGVTLAKNAASTGTYHLDGGTLKTQMVSMDPLGTSGVLDFNGGTLIAGAANASFMTGLTAANVQSGGAFIDTNTFNITIGQALLNGGGSGGLTKSGTGTLTLSAASTYTGNTTVNGGTLSIANSYLADASTVSIASGAVMDLNFAGNDTIAALSLGGSVVPAGTYNSSTPTYGSYFTGTGSLVVGVVLTPYQSWAQTNITNINPSADATATGDPDKDGVTNLMEFILGGNPLASSTSILPTLAVNATNFVFTFNRSDESEAEAALQFQWGTSLAAWPNVLTVGAASAPADGNGVVVSVNEGSPTTNPDVITVTIPRTNALAGKLFGRLQAVK
ncbi:MAG: autotransporter-associated beta strand repeat-containing protein, partial [Luteolibacter sp.]